MNTKSRAKGRRQPRDLSIIDLQREVDRSWNQARVNEGGADVADAQALNPALPAENRTWLVERAKAGRSEAAKLRKRAEKMAAELELRDAPPCIDQPACGCPRCTEDGHVTAILGNFRSHTIVIREHVIEAYLAFTDRPRRKPALLRSTDDGLLPEERGKRREEIVELLQKLLRGVAASARPGRRPGDGIDVEGARSAIDALVAGGATVTDACEIVALDLGFAPESIRAAYYRKSSK